MDATKPRSNMTTAFSDNFKQVQEKWLVSDDQFKMGYLFFGPVAANQLKAMFYLIPASRIIAKDEEMKTERYRKFIDDLDAFRLKCSQYALVRRKSLVAGEQFPLVPEYIALDNEYDILVKQFFLMMFETGFSP